MHASAVSIHSRRGSKRQAFDKTRVRVGAVQGLVVDRSHRPDDDNLDDHHHQKERKESVVRSEACVSVCWCQCEAILIYACRALCVPLQPSSHQQGAGLHRGCVARVHRQKVDAGLRRSRNTFFLSSAGTCCAHLHATSPCHPKLCTLRTLKASVLASVPWGEAEAGSPPGPDAGGTPRHAASRPHTARRRRSLMPHEISARIS